MSEEWGRITVYDPSMAVQVAGMFNDFDPLWPGGFGGGIPYDEQRVRDWLDKSSAIANLIAVDADGAPVGFCGLCPHWRDEHAAYINILGVVPRVKGKKYGKRLLLQAIDAARGRGIQRVDLHTWSGNLNAVPLYKKVGMFWVPETSVYMQNYVPALSQTSLGQGWFAVHPDWYGCFQRELAQAPDRQVVDGFELYTYTFQAGEDRLVGEVDRYGWGICGIERALDGAAIAVKTRLREHDVLIGLPNEMTISVDNRTGHDLDLALTVEPFKGLRWEEPFPLSFSVRDGATASLSRSFVVDAGGLSETARAGYDAHRGSEVIRSRVIFDGQVVDLVTGGKLQPAVGVSSGRSYQVAPAGGTAEVCLDLVNHARQPLRARVDAFVEDAAGSQQRFEVALAPEERSGIVVPVPLPADVRQPVRVLYVTPTIQGDGTSPHVPSPDGPSADLKPAAMPVHRVSVVADLPDLATVVEANDGKSVNLLTDALDVHVELEGGRVRLQQRTLPGVRRRLGFQAGPPFGITLDDTLSYQYEVLRDGRSCTLVLRADSRQFPGLRIGKYVRVAPGVREVEHWITLTNLRSDGPQAVGGRLGTGGGGGLSLDPFSEFSRSFTPVERSPGGNAANQFSAVECDAMLPVMRDTMLPQEPEHWPETWTAAQTLQSGAYVALFWRPDGIDKIKVDGGMLSSLECAPRTLSPGETAEVLHVWYGFSYSSLPDVRNRWSQLVGRAAIPRAERYVVPTVPPISARFAGAFPCWGKRPTRHEDAAATVSPSSPVSAVEGASPCPGPKSPPNGNAAGFARRFAAQTAGENVVVRGQTARKRIELSFVTPYPLPGELCLDLPPGWQGAFLTPDGPRPTLTMPEPAPGTPSALEVELQVPAGAPGACEALRLHFSGEYELDFDLPLLLADEGTVRVERQSLDGQGVLAVSNGVLRFSVLDGLSGSLIRLQDAQGRAYFYDNVPQVMPWFFFENHVGGVQPMVAGMRIEVLFGELEALHVEAVEEGLWAGAEVSWQALKDEYLRGQQFRLAYLTLPGSSVVRVRLRHHNPTPRRVEWFGSVLVNVALGGSAEGTVVHAPGGQGTWVRNPAPKPFVNPGHLGQPWVNLLKGEQSLALLIPRGHLAAAQVLDFPEFVMGVMYSAMETDPQGENEIEFALALNQADEHVKPLIAALGR